MAAAVRFISGLVDRQRDADDSAPLAISFTETEESGVGALAAGPPNLKRKSATQPVPGPPDLKRPTKEPGAGAEASEAMSQLSLFSLDDACLLLVLSKLRGTHVAQAAYVSRRWRRLAGDERLWQALCRRDWGLTQPRTLDLHPLTYPYRDSYIACLDEFRRYGRLAVRAHQAWLHIEAWTAQHIPAIRATLRAGASEAQLNDAETQLGVTFPLAMRALYRIHDGQELPADRAADEQGEALLAAPSTMHGLFGGYCYYDQAVSVRLLPLRRLVLWTQRLRTQVFRTDDADPRIVIAGNFNLKKVLVLDCGSGLVRACLQNKNHSLKACPADPEPGAHDGMLRWFEEHARRLQAGIHTAEPQPATLEDTRIPRTLSISLFPCKPPMWTWAVTHGVRVCVSTVFVPEGTCPIGADASGKPTRPRFFFVYSTRLELLSEAEQRECGVARPAATVQLAKRHWVMRNAQGNRVSETGGEGVIGVQPTLHAGGDAFTYQSCTPQERLPMVLQGEFIFVQGTLADASGPPFGVKIPTVILKMPTFIF